MPVQIVNASGEQYGMVVNADGSINTIASGTSTTTSLDFTLSYKQLIDYQGGNQPVYIGLATPGTGSEVASWMLRKYIYEDVAGFPYTVAVLFGSGNNNFDKKWSDRSGTNEVYS